MEKNALMPGMLTRPGVSRPRPRPRPEVSRPRPSSTKQYLATRYGGTNDAGIPVYCKCNYTVIHCVWKNIGHFDLGLGFERGQGQGQKPQGQGQGLTTLAYAYASRGKNGCEYLRVVFFSQPRQIPGLSGGVN